MLNWVARFNIFCFLDNSNYPGKTGDFECMLAAGAKNSISLSTNDPFGTLKNFYDEQPRWLFGHLGYDINTTRSTFTGDGFDDGFFFTPDILLRLTNSELIIDGYTESENAQAIFNAINNRAPTVQKSDPSVNIQSRYSRGEYIQIIDRIRQHIKRGDCYELNFCQEFFSDDAIIDPFYIFKKLQSFSPNPFSAFYKVNDNYCMCASPERFLKKKGQELISQPIKGTSKRDSDPLKDEENKTYLRTSPKETSENVMVVDLVRNDLSKICMEGSVQVEEIFGIYSFPQVHQMISTIKGILNKDIHWTKALAETFPMGSMTGAPKKRVMELIAQYEKNNRGLFSGSIGYITPTADFDFNVVIRSIFYNQAARHLSFWAGSGITFYSDPVSEFEECLLKAEAIMKVLK